LDHPKDKLSSAAMYKFLTMVAHDQYHQRSFGFCLLSQKFTNTHTLCFENHLVPSFAVALMVRNKCQNLKHTQDTTPDIHIKYMYHTRPKNISQVKKCKNSQ